MTSEIISADENQPELSIVCTTRNDDHGGDLLKRMRLCFNGIFKLAERHKLICELIVVEWNPPDHKPKLQEVLPWPEEHKYCSVRVIEVPNGIHQRYKHSKTLPLYQMIAKNVGIRRARGRMVLATNVDILFTDALFAFFASGQMDENKMYRVDRYDTDGDIRETDTIDVQLATARDTTLRVASRRGTLNYRSGQYNCIYTTFADDPQFHFDAHNRYPLHTNASGDFTLLSRKNWFEMGGYWETDSFSFHLDSILCYTAHFAGIVEEYLSSPMWIHHIEHDAGWAPEANKIAELEQRLNLGGIPQISDKQLDRFVDTMAETSQPIKNPNIVNWGLAAEHLTEQVISMADWDSRDDPLRTAIHSPPLPSLPLHGERSCLSDTPDEIDGTDDHYISFICSVSNDENDLGVTQKVQLLSDRLSKQCETFGLYAELLLVGCEPNCDGPGLTKSLTGPSGTNLDIHVITVPESDRRQLRIADTIRYFDFISNNVAACRASGKFLLFAPVETFFSDEFIQFLSLRRLNLNCLYGLCKKESNKDKIKIDSQSSKEELEKYFFSSANKIADGVFELISKASLTAFRGYPEVPATSEHISQILQCMAKAAGMRVVAFDRSIVLSASFKRKSEVPEDQSCPLLDYKTEIVPWCNLMKRDKSIINPNRDDWGFRNRQYKIYDVKSKTWLDEISNDVEISPAALYTSGAADDFQEMIDQIARSKNNPFFQEISAKSLKALKSIITAINPQKVIEFGSGTGLSIRTCLKADSELEVVAVGNNHTELKNSSLCLSIDFNRVRLIEKNPWKVRQTDLWNGRERVVLIFNLNILSDYGDVFEIFERLIPALKEHDLVVINGLWYSPIKLHERSVTSFFSNNVIQDINPLENKEFHFASYWETGSYLGAGDITNLVEWFNRYQVDVKSPSGTSLVQFKAFNGLKTYPPIRAPDAESETGSFFYTPANSWVRAQPHDEPLGQLINSHCEIGTENYKDGDFESAFYHFGEALMWGCLHPERILLACEINLGKIREAIDLASNSFDSDRVSGEMLNRIRRFYIATDDRYTVRQVKEIW